MRMRRAPYFLLAGYGALRLGELLVSRRHERSLAAAGFARAPERGFALMVAAHLSPFVLAPLELAYRPRRPLSVSVRGVALAALAAALALRAWTVRTLADRWNVHIHGGPGMRVATDGPYRFVRHPNYTAVIVEVAALPLAAGAPWTALVASVFDGIALTRRIRDEEAVLETSETWRTRMRPKPRFFPRPWAASARSNAGR